MIDWRLELWTEDDADRGFQMAFTVGQYLELYQLLRLPEGVPPPPDEPGRAWNKQSDSDDLATDGIIYRRFCGSIDPDEIRRFATAILSLVEPKNGTQLRKQ